MENDHRPPSERTATILIRKGEMAAHFTMTEAIECMSAAFAGLSSGRSVVPERYVTDSPGGQLTFLMKPAFSEDLNTSSVKFLSQRNSGPAGDIPTITGIVLLIDSRTGELLSMMDGEHITALRTGAASGLATRLLSRRDSKHMALFGCGAQGRTQLEAVCAVREIEKVWLFDTSRSRAESFIEEMSDRVPVTMEVTTDLPVLRDADIICTATPSTRPLFGPEHIRKGTHINAVGSFKPHMQELDPELIHSSRLYLDDRRACTGESGDLLEAVKRFGPLKDQLAGEIGQLVLGRIEGRTGSEETNIFKSVGTAIQDLVVADAIYRKSRTEGFGEEIRLYE